MDGASQDNPETHQDDRTGGDTMIPEYINKNIVIHQRDGVDFLNILGPESAKMVWMKAPNGSLGPSATGGKVFSQMEAVERCAAAADAASYVLAPDGILAIRLASYSVRDVEAAISKRTHLQYGGEVYCYFNFREKPGQWSSVILFHKGEPVHHQFDDTMWFFGDTITHLIETFTEPGDVVVDPFCGTGDSMEAAVKSYRIAVVNDQDPNAVAAIVDRYKELNAR
jgi:hypothetical protein